MKKRLLFLMLSACIFCAVSLKFLSDEEVRNETEYKTDITEEVITDVEEAESEAAAEAAVVTLTESEAELSAVNVAASEWDYCYQCLGEEDRIIYLEIYDILLNFGKDVPISLTNPDKIGDIFQCVLNDHPEIFYVQGYTYTSYMQQDTMTQLTLSGTYTMTREEASFCQKKIDAYVSECLAGINAGAEDYEKVKYIYEYLISHTEYCQDAKENQNICSVFLYGESVCQGYAKATQYLLKQAGVFCTLVIGSVAQGEGHAWNLVRMDGSFYYVDTTWGDASYQMEEGTKDEWSRGFPQINYDYLGVTMEQLLKTHIPSHVVPLPYCVSTDCNYYVKEGTYVTACDEELLKLMFDTKFQKNGGYLTIKCADDTVYQEVRKLLVEDQKIFEYIHQTDGTVAYSDNGVQCSISFWIWDN